MKITHRDIVALTLVAVLAGAGAGVVSSIFTSRALDDYAKALLGDRGFTALEPRKPNANPADYQAAIKRVRDVQSRSLAVFTKKSTDSELVNKWLDLTNVVGVGTVVSADGWILTSSDELAGIINPVTGVEVWVRGTRFAISEVKTDDLTPLVLIHLVGAYGLSPVGFGASEDILDGDMVFVTPQISDIVATSVQNSEELSLIGPQLAETYGASWSLVSGAYAHGPVFSATGDFLAFDLKHDLSAIPLHHASAFVQDVIRDGLHLHAVLGAYVVDLTSVYNLSPEIRQGLSTGALVYAPIGKLAVPIGLPANEAGVLARDIITAVDGEAVSSTTSLAELLATYDPGQTVKLSIVRAGAPIEISVVLGESGALLY